MSSFLTQNIKHTIDFNPGGIASIHLLDIRDFVGYKYKSDQLYDSCFVESIITSGEQYELDSAVESLFTETQSNSIYKQELTTFIRSANSNKLSALLIASQNKYLVIFRNNQGKAFTFGSDGGVSLSFKQQTGQTGEVSGYSITLTKQSIYPLLEVALDEINKSPLWILDSGKWNAENIWTREGIWKTK